MKRLLLIQPISLLRKFYSKAIWNLGRENKVIYLTFDDGPIPVLSEWVLDELEKYNAKATFFCVGENISKHPHIFERMKREGHTVGNHTMTHCKGFRTNEEIYFQEVEECRRFIGNNLFRPPYGQLKPGQYRGLIERGYKIIFWDVISYDFEKISPKKCTENVIRNTTSGSIVLFHDNVKAEKNLRQALPTFLKHFSREGYSFRSIPG